MQNSIHTLQRRFLLTLLVLSISWGFSANFSNVLLAQEPGAVQNPPTIEPSVLATAQAREAELIAEIEARSIFDFYVAYLISSDATLGADYISGQSLSELLGAEVFHSWEDFEKQNQATPFQIILLHQSIYDQIDKAWTQDAYRNQVLLIGIDIPFDRFTEVTGDQCLEETNPHFSEYEEPVILLFNYVVELEEAESASKEQHLVDIHDVELTACSGKHDIGDTSLLITHGVTNFVLESPEFVTYLKDVIELKTVTYHIVGTKR